MERFWSKVRKTDGCWEWLASKDRGGYGQFTQDDRNLRAHRVAYVLSGYELPDAVTLDHLCNNRGCVNPAHLKPATQKENLLRAETGPTAVNARKTHCDHGHEFTAKNTRITQGQYGLERRCVACSRLTSREAHQRIKHLPRRRNRLRIDPTLLAQIDLLAAQKNIGRAEIVNELLRAALKEKP